MTYYWPPSGGPGVQRVLKFVKYLPEFGWEPHILTVENGEYPAIDETLIKDIHPRAKVHKVTTVEFFDLFRKIRGKKQGDAIETYELVKERKELSLFERLAQFIRLNILIPDARVGWYLFAKRKSLQIAREVDPDIIFSSSPPHSLQLVASAIAQKLKCKWIADFRDPWTKSFYDKGMKRWLISENTNFRLEQRIINKADKVTSVSPGVIELLQAEEKGHIIPNGYDEDDFDKDISKSDKFKIVYTGHIASLQNPQRFFEALANLPPEQKAIIDVDFYGSVDPSVYQTVSKYELEDIVHFHGYVDHDLATGYMMAADLLLLMIPRTHAKGILTGKLFEYLATGNYILGIGDEAGDAASIIKKCNAGCMINYDKDPTNILSNRFESWKLKEESKAIRKEIKAYSRKNLTGKLVQLFEELCD